MGFDKDAASLEQSMPRFHYDVEAQSELERLTPSLET